MTLEDAAMWYARERGWKVIPLHFPIDGRCSCGRPNCPSPAKHPIAKLAPSGARDGTTDIETIQRWWKLEPRANIGLCTGNGLLALDIDVAKGGDTTVKSYYLPDAPTSLTGGGGEHRLFAIDTELGNSVGLLGPGVDTRGEGGYIVAPPSVHISGRVYEWEVDHSPASISVPKLPDDISSLLSHNGGSTERKGSTLPERIEEGERNDRLFRHACNLRRHGLSDEEILTVLRAENERRCDPPLDDRELLRIARSAAKFEPEPILKVGVSTITTTSKGPVASCHVIDELPFPLQLTDLGNARALAAWHGERVRYVNEWKAWLVWDGSRWQEDKTGEVVQLAEQYVRALYAAASDIEDSDQRKKQLAHAIRSASKGRIEAAVSLLASEPGIQISQAVLDKGAYMLNCANGVLNLASPDMELLPHTPTDMITKITRVPFEPAARCPRWEAFLLEIMAGRDNLVRYLQRSLGYTLTADTSEQAMFVLHGIGANGKSTMLEVVREVLGDYAKTAAFSSFVIQPGSNGPRDDLAYLQNARMVVASEPRIDARLDESLIKQLTGGEVISCRRLYGTHYEYNPSYTLWLACNHKPAIRGTDKGIWRRLKLIPFEVTFEEQAQNKHLKGQLLEEAVGILAWLVRGCLDWQFSGLDTPSEVEVATEEYRDDQDPFSEFIADCCDIGDELSVLSTEIYHAYCRWAEKQRVPALSQTALGRYLTERGYRMTRERGGRKRRRGLALKGELDIKW